MFHGESNYLTDFRSIETPVALIVIGGIRHIAAQTPFA